MDPASLTHSCMRDLVRMKGFVSQCRFHVACCGHVLKQRHDLEIHCSDILALPGTVQGLDGKEGLVSNVSIICIFWVVWLRNTPGCLPASIRFITYWYSLLALSAKVPLRSVFEAGQPQTSTHTQRVLRECHRQLS